jgi:hypothetical protein
MRRALLAIIYSRSVILQLARIKRVLEEEYGGRSESHQGSSADYTMVADQPDLYEGLYVNAVSESFVHFSISSTGLVPLRLFATGL